jgi:hypothetical protein
MGFQVIHLSLVNCWKSKIKYITVFPTNSRLEISYIARPDRDPDPSQQSRISPSRGSTETAVSSTLGSMKVALSPSWLISGQHRLQRGTSKRAVLTPIRKSCPSVHRREFHNCPAEPDVAYQYLPYRDLPGMAGWGTTKHALTVTVTVKTQGIVLT